MLIGVGGKGPTVNVLVLAHKFVVLLELIIIMKKNVKPTCSIFKG
jgi:hypothetical protein